MKPRRAIALGMVLVTLIAYAGVAGHSFVSYDDPAYVFANDEVRGGVSWDGVRWAFTTSHAGNYHPLTWLSHMLDCELFGLEPRGHHLMSAAIHALNAALVFLVFHAMTHALGRSLVVAALFALHPLHVESVAWVSERKDVLSTCFGLLALLAWVRYARLGSKAAFGAALFAFALSLLSKPMWVTLPFVLLLLDVWPLTRWRQRGDLPRLLLEKLPFFALTGASIAVTLHAQSGGIWAHLPLELRSSNALVAWPRYLSKSFWPLDLAFFYPYRDPLPVAQVVGSGALLLGLSAAALASLRQRPYLAVGWLWFLGMLVPVIGLVQVGIQSMADRYTYAPSIGLFAALVWGVHGALPRTRARELGLGAVAILGVAICAGLTRAQVAHWRDDMSLCRHALDVTEHNFVAHTCVANGLVSAGDLQSGIRHHREALRLAPWYTPAHHGLGTALLDSGDVDGALEQLEVVVEARPGRRDALYHLGRALEQAGRFAEALDRYQQQLETDPEHLGARLRLAVLYATHPDPELRDPEAAIRLAEQACSQTGYASASELDVLGAALASAGRFDEAIEAAQRARVLARDAELAAMIDWRIGRYRLRQALRGPSDDR